MHKKKKWTQEEIIWLKNNYHNQNIKKADFEKKLERNWASIIAKARVELRLVRKFIWTEDKLNYLKENYNNKNLTKSELELILGNSWKNIINKASQLKLVRTFRDCSKLFTLNNEICNRYKNGENIPFLAKKYFCSKDSIREILIKNNVDRRPSEENKRIYNFDENFFNIINNEYKAYFLGLLYADGNNFVKTGKVHLGLQETDKHIIEELKNLIKYEGHIYISQKDKKATMYNLVIASKRLSKQLVNLGCVNKKSLILTFPTEEQVPKELQNHFIRGYFDGDGSVTKDLTHKNDCISITGAKLFIEDVRNILVEECDLNPVKLIPAGSKTGFTFSIFYQGSHNIKRIREYLYKDSTISLNRKREKMLLINPLRKEKKNKKENFQRLYVKK